MKLRLVVAGLCFVLPLCGESPSSEQALKTTIVSRTELVLVPAVVSSKSGGEHISGLGKDAFTLEEDGKPQRVDVFEEVTGAAPVARPAAETPGTISNYAVKNPNERRVVLVVLDLLNTPFLHQAQGKAALIQFLEKSVPEDEQIAVFALTGSGLRQLHSFTSDTRALIATLHKVSAQMGTTERIDPDDAAHVDVNPIPGSEDEFVQAFQQLTADADALFAAHVQRNSIRTTLAALEQLAGAFEGVPGRKSLIWATGGFPFTVDDPHAFAHMGTDMVEFYERTWRALNNANIAVYPVDITGLAPPDLRRGFGGMVPGTPPASTNPRSSRALGGRIAAPRPLPYDPHREQLGTMLSFAAATGGKAFINRNDLENGFRSAAQDSRSYYLLGYYLHGDRKPGWHKLKVKLNNVSGAQVRARDGFYAGQPVQDTDKAAKKEALVAIASPVDYTGVHFAVQLTGTYTYTRSQSAEGASGSAAPTPVPEKKIISFDVSIPSGSLSSDATRDNLVDFDLLVFALAADSRITSDLARHVAGRLKPGSHIPFRLQESLEVPPATTELRFLVRDNLNGKVGTARTSELK